MPTMRSGRASENFALRYCAKRASASGPRNRPKSRKSVYTSMFSDVRCFKRFLNAATVSTEAGVPGSSPSSRKIRLGFSALEANGACKEMADAIRHTHQRVRALRAENEDLMARPITHAAQANELD